MHVTGNPARETQASQASLMLQWDVSHKVNSLLGFAGLPDEQQFINKLPGGCILAHPKYTPQVPASGVVGLQMSGHAGAIQRDQQPSRLLQEYQEVGVWRTKRWSLGVANANDVYARFAS